MTLIVKKPIIPHEKLKIYTSVRNKITFRKFSFWLWEIKLNTELTKYNEHGTNPKYIISHLNEFIKGKFSNFKQNYTDAPKTLRGIDYAVIK